MNQVKDTFRGIFDDVVKFAGNSAAIIEDATVYTTPLINTGRYYETMFSGKNKDLVEKYAKERCEAVDSMRSPSLTCGGRAMPYRDGFHVTLKFYGLD